MVTFDHNVVCSNERYLASLMVVRTVCGSEKCRLELVLLYLSWFGFLKYHFLELTLFVHYLILPDI